MVEKIDQNSSLGRSEPSERRPPTSPESTSSEPLPPPPTSEENWLENPEKAFGSYGTSLPPDSKPQGKANTPTQNPNPDLKSRHRDRSDEPKQRSEKNKYKDEIQAEKKKEEALGDERTLSRSAEGETLPLTRQGGSAARLTMKQALDAGVGNAFMEQASPAMGGVIQKKMSPWADPPPPEKGAHFRSSVTLNGTPSLPPKNSFMSLQGGYKGLNDLVEKMQTRSGWGNFGAYGPGNTLYDLLLGMPQKDQVYAARREVRKVEQELKIKMRLIMFLILMGDVAGAMRQLVFEAERTNRLFNRLLTKQLGRVREAKAKILRALGRKPPPRAHANVGDTQGQDRDRLAQQRYNQWVSVTSQLMSEVSQGERELMDLIRDGRRHINEMWDALMALKESEARTTRQIFQSFRG